MKKDIAAIDITTRPFLSATNTVTEVYNKSYLVFIVLIPLITALSGWSSIYSIFKISTCKKKE